MLTLRLLQGSLAKAIKSVIRDSLEGALILDAESVFQSVPHAIHFFSSQNSKPPLKFDCRDRLDLLQMKRAGFQERLRHVQFPAVAAQRSFAQGSSEAKRVPERCINGSDIRQPTQHGIDLTLQNGHKIVCHHHRVEPDTGGFTLA